MTDSEYMELAPLEWRASEDRTSPGHLFGTMLTYGQPATDRPEVFEDSALEWRSAGVPLRLWHHTQKGKSPLAGTPIVDFAPSVEGLSLKVDIQLPDSTFGRMAAEKVRSGELKGMSPEFRARAQRYSEGMRRISKADLEGVALVDESSYQTLVEVRAKLVMPTRRRRWR